MMDDDPGAATAAASAKEAIALAIRRRNGLQTSAMHSTQQVGRMNTTVVHGMELDITRKLSFSAALNDPADDDDDNAADASKVQIVIRIRPLIGDAADGADTTTTTATASSSNRRESTGESECFRVVSDTSMIAQPPKTSQAYRSTGTATSFQFSRIFPPTTAQRELFVATTKPVLKAAFDGKSGLVFAYGVTNSGKTYTISGTTQRPGMLPRALAFVIKELARRKENDAAPVTHVTASYLEVYNENVYDLLAAPSRKRRALRLQDCDGKIQVKGMLEKPLRSLADGEELLAVGLRNKQVAETSCNSDSSRSHCVFTLHFYHQRAPRGGLALRSKVSIVDLAGSERSAKTGATGLRMQEASKINGSLMNLMRCLETLRWNQQHPPALHKMVPFRESKLTRLFQENLVGKALGPLVMIVAVNPSSHEFDETLRTLKYSAVARELVPVQPRPAQTRAQARRAGAQAFVYDLDGRLKKKQRLSVESETPVPRKAADSVLAGSSAVISTSMLRSSAKRARDAALASSARSTATKRVTADPPSSRASSKALLPLLSPDLMKAKALSDDDDDDDDTDDNLSKSKEELGPAAAAADRERSYTSCTPQTVSAAAVASLQVAYHEMEIRVTELEVENDDLRRQLSAVNAEKLELEVQIRAEIGKQMHEQLQQIRAQYQDMAKRPRSDGENELLSARKAAQVADERAALQFQVHQLQLQLNECEDEMERVRARHELELDELRHPVKREH